MWASKHYVIARLIIINRPRLANIVSIYNGRDSCIATLGLQKTYQGLSHRCANNASYGYHNEIIRRALKVVLSYLIRGSNYPYKAQRLDVLYKLNRPALLQIQYHAQLFQWLISPNIYPSVPIPLAVSLT